MTLTLAQLQQRIEASFQPDKAAGIDSLFQYIVPDGSNFHVRIADRRLSFHAGDASESADLTLTLDWDTLEALLAGRLGGMQAFMFGRVKVKGSLALASRLIEVLTLA